jgi:hypothetical protein
MAKIGDFRMSEYSGIMFMCSPEDQKRIENQLREMGATPDLTRQDPKRRIYCWKISYPIAFEAIGRYDLNRTIALDGAHPPTITLPEYDSAWDALEGASQISAQLNEDMAKKRVQRPDPVETLGRVTECADAVQQALSKVRGKERNPDDRSGLLQNGFCFYSGITSILLGQEARSGIINTPAILGLGQILEQTKPSKGQEESPEVQQVRNTAEAAYDTVSGFYHQTYSQKTQ